MAVSKNRKNKGGRPTKYKEEYCDAIIKYFDIEPTRTITERFFYKNGDEKEKEIEVANELPTIEAFCRSIKINKSTLHEWVKNHKEFSNAYKVAKDLQVDLWLKNSLKGLYNPTFSIFAGKNMFGWRDKTEVDHTTKGEKITYSEDQINAIIDRHNRSRKN